MKNSDYTDDPEDYRVDKVSVAILVAVVLLVSKLLIMTFNS